MTMNDPNDIAADFASHNWAAAALPLIFFALRLLKDDGPLPYNIPSKYRPWVATGLGVLSGILQKVVTGTAWKPAILGGLFSAFGAMAGHDLLVQSARGGKEPFSKRADDPAAPPPAV